MLQTPKTESVLGDCYEEGGSALPFSLPLDALSKTMVDILLSEGILGTWDHNSLGDYMED